MGDLGKRHIGGLAQGMLFGENGQHPVLLQRKHLKILPCGQRKKSAIHHSGLDPLLNLQITAFHELKPDIGIFPAELLNHPRQPVNRNAGEGADGNRPCLQAMDICDLLLQLLIPFHDLPDGLNYLLAVDCQPDSRAVSQQQSEAKFRFQTADRVADAGLGEAQHLCGPGQASQLHYLEEHLVFADAQTAVHLLKLHEFYSCIL
ncbi:hypothetical protein D3C73_942600 [compost metagenome]